MDKFKSIVKNIFIGIGVILALAYIVGELYGIFGDWLTKKEWTGVYYNGSSITISNSEKFKTLDDCKVWVEKKYSENNSNDSQLNFKCGRNCKYAGRKPGSTVDYYDCEEIVEL